MSSPTNALFAEVDPLLRVPVVALIGGFRPEPGLRSWFGGNFWLPPEFEWPKTDGSPMHPILQVVVAELPIIPDVLRHIEVLQVFVSDELPVGEVSNGNYFRIVVHQTTQGLSPTPPSAPNRGVRPFQIKWLEGASEGPCWEEVWEHAANAVLKQFVEGVPDCFKVYGDRYRRHYGTKFGGWASYIQGVYNLPGRYVFQVSSEEKPSWMVGDAGNLYFYIDDRDEWWMTWDCY